MSIHLVSQSAVLMTDVIITRRFNHCVCHFSLISDISVCVFRVSYINIYNSHTADNDINHHIPAPWVWLFVLRVIANIKAAISTVLLLSFYVTVL